MSKTKSFIFQGKQSFSSSKLEQLSKKFTELNKFETNIESLEIYFVEIKNGESELENLRDILSAQNLTDTFNFYIGPRLGTISPWASKTEDILKLAVKRMLPGGPLAKKQMTKLKIYSGDKHPHDIQKPILIDFKKLNKNNLTN